MNIKEAKDLLNRMAGGEYHAIAYEFSDHGGHTKQKCSVYVDGQDFHVADTWSEALNAMYIALNPLYKEMQIEINVLKQQLENYDDRMMDDNNK